MIGNFDFKNKYWGGIGIRQQGGFLINLGMNVIEQLGITYAYEFNRNGVASFSSGSHEIMISYKLGKKNNTSQEEKRQRLNRAKALNKCIYILLGTSIPNKNIPSFIT